MTSKEALEHLINDCMFIFWYDNSSKAIETIKQDLERLEQLEKFYKLCVKKYVPLDSLSPKFWQSKEEWLELMSYDYYLFLCDDVCEYVVKDNQRLTLEEFKMIYGLLKEVLNNDK